MTPASGLAHRFHSQLPFTKTQTGRFPVHTKGIRMSSIRAYFETLLDWKRLPAYRLEPRVDAIIGLALPKILARIKGLEVTTVIPELPLRIGSVQPEHEGKVFANRSYKVDFFMVTRGGKCLLVEFKTDSGSRREKQDDYLESARKMALRIMTSRR